jgi:hypothetical protein
MWFFWVFSLVPIALGIALLYFDKHIRWQEMLGGSAAALAIAGIFQLVASVGMTDDVETWSGYGTQARQYSRWQEYYEYAVYRTEIYYETETTTDSEGHSHSTQVMHTRQVFDHWEPTSRWHDTSWTLFTTLADFEIDDGKFSYMCDKYNDNHAVQGKRTTWEHNSKMIGGDPNDYVSDNKTGWIEPVIQQKHFVNRVKAAPSLFSFVKVPTNISVYPWPAVKDWNRSARVMGTAASMIDTLKWDQMNAVLGATKKINLIIVGFPSGTAEDMAKWQEAKWIGGKKNDLVICFAGGNQKTNVEWCSVFGWSEKGLAKHNIEDILLKNPVNNNILSKISDEVKLNYEKKNWHKFDYLTIEPPAWSYWVYILVLVLTQGGLYTWFHFNEFDNDSFNKPADLKGAEEAFMDKLSRKWNAILGWFRSFFIKSPPAPYYLPPLNQDRRLPPPQPLYRRDDNGRSGPRQKNRRNFR